MKRHSFCPSPAVERPPLRHIWRMHARGLADLLFKVVEFADAGDRVNLLRYDGQRFTIVRNGTLFLVRDHMDAPIGTFDTVGACIAAGDRQLEEVEDARLQHEADFGGDPMGAA